MFVDRSQSDESEDTGQGRAADDGLPLKLRFADHEHQSLRHQEADYNWFGKRGTGLTSETLRNMLEGAVDFFHFGGTRHADDIQNEHRHADDNIQTSQKPEAHTASVMTDADAIANPCSASDQETQGKSCIRHAAGRKMRR